MSLMSFIGVVSQFNARWRVERTYNYMRKAGVARVSRNISVHEYGELDHNRLYTVARDGVPELIRALEKIIGKKKR